MSRGQFISVEGGEGVGKSTLVGCLSQRFRNANLEVVTTREPGGSRIGEQIRGLFKNVDDKEPLTPEAELALICAARSQHVKYLIEPALSSGQWVLCDRYVDSTKVYQGCLGGARAEAVDSTIKIGSYGVLPVLTVLLDCPVEISFERLQQRNRQALEEGLQLKACRFDSAEQKAHEKLRVAYLELANKEPKRFLVLDASLDIADLTDRVWGACVEKGWVCDT